MAKTRKCAGVGRVRSRRIGQGNVWVSAGWGRKGMQRMECLGMRRVGDKEMRQRERQCLGIWLGIRMGRRGGGVHTCPLTVANGPFGNPSCLLSSLLSWFGCPLHTFSLLLPFSPFASVSGSCVCWSFATLFFSIFVIFRSFSVVSVIILIVIYHVAFFI